jgi:hypothetical protein
MNSTEKFEDLLKSETYKDIFNEKYVDGLVRRLDDLTSRDQRMQLVQITLVLFLGLTLLSVNLSFSMFGLSTADANNLREVLLLVLSSVQMANTLPSVEQANIQKLLLAVVERDAKGSEVARKALYLRYGVGGPILNILPDGGYSVRHFITLVAMALAFVGWAMFYFVLVIVIEIAAIVSILVTPTISLPVSVLVTLYVVLASVSAGLFRTLSRVDKRAPADKTK